ncbi:MAG: NAD(P)H-hydrate dehydratase [Chitinophagales bacterium]
MTFTLFAFAEIADFCTVKKTTDLPEFHRRNRAAHKGDFGHVLIAAGSYGKMGAAVLSTGAALRSGAGLVTALIPECGYEILQITRPEAMVQTTGSNVLSGSFDVSAFSVTAIGPGMGTHPETKPLLLSLLSSSVHPLVLDADALNWIASDPLLWELIPENSVLTPHPGEFHRLSGGWYNDEDKWRRFQEMSEKRQVVMVLKGDQTRVVAPDGRCYINSTGNPGMAKGGSGDVLTGIIAALMAQHYEAFEAAVLGVYIHGLAGDLAKDQLSETAMKAGDLIDYLPKAFQMLEKGGSK